MKIKFLKEEKNELEFELESLTLAEILRVYLNKDSAVTFVAWKKEHETMDPILKVKTSGKNAKIIVKNAVNSILKELDQLSEDFKKSIKSQ